MRTIFDIYVFIMASKYFYSIIRHSQIYSLTSLHEIWGQLCIDSLMATRKMTVNQNIYFGEECTRLVHYWAAEKIKMAGPI